MNLLLQLVKYGNKNKSIVCFCSKIVIIIFQNPLKVDKRQISVRHDKNAHHCCHKQPYFMVSNSAPIVLTNFNCFCNCYFWCHFRYFGICSCWDQSVWTKVMVLETDIALYKINHLCISNAYDIMVLFKWFTDKTRLDCGKLDNQKELN